MVKDVNNTKLVMKEEIIKFIIQKKDRVAHESALFLLFNSTSSKGKARVREVLRRMVIDGSISYDKTKGMVKLKTTDYVVGEIVLNGVNDFAVQLDTRKVSVKSKHLNGAYVGDKVLYNTKDKSIKSVVEKKNNPIIFSCSRIDNDIIMAPISLPGFEEYRFKDIDKLKFNGGEIVSAYVFYNEEDECYDCYVYEVIGKGTDSNIKGKIVLAANGYDINFPKKVLEEAELTPDRVYEEDMKGRVDLRKLKSFTLDCAKRMNTYDDALSVEINEDGHYMLYFHVIDVPHYVKPGMAMYEEARKRSKKIYAHGYEYARNMLPEKLAHGICSFVKGEDRLAKTISLEFNRDGECIAYDFFDSVINVRENFCTRDADDIYDAGYDESNDACNPEYIREFVLLNQINSFIKKEPFIGINSTSTDSMHGILINIIEYANERVANHFLTLPFIYKTFRYPTKKEIENKVNQLSKKEWTPISDLNYVKKNIIERILSFYKLPHISIYELAVIDILNNECYTFSAKNKGHFRYGVPRYTHINSPARSFVNLVNLSLFDKYNKEFDPKLEAMKSFENELDGICKEYNENYSAIERLEHSLNGRNEQDKELEQAVKGVVVDKKHERVLVHVENRGMFRVYSSDPTITLGTELLLKINKSPDNKDKYNAKILYYKNGNKNI